MEDEDFDDFFGGDDETFEEYDERLEEEAQTYGEGGLMIDEDEE